MDSALRAIVEAVEAGKPGPPVRLLVAGGAVRGTVIPITAFLDAMESELAREASKGRGRTRIIGTRGMDELDRHANASALIDPIRSSPPAEIDALSLAEAKWWSFDNKTTLEVAALRIPFAAISAWWFAGETGKEDSTWYVGAILPLGDS